MKYMFLNVSVNKGNYSMFTLFSNINLMISMGYLLGLVLWGGGGGVLLNTTEWFLLNLRTTSS